MIEDRPLWKQVKAQEDELRERDEMIRRLNAENSKLNADVDALRRALKLGGETL